MALAIAAKLLGALEITWTAVILFVVLSNVVVHAVLFAYRAGRDRVFGVPLQPIWMGTDIVGITWSLYLSGGSQSTWFPWYLANAAATAYVAGRRATIAVMLLNTAAYLALVALTEDLSTSTIARALTNMLALYGAAFFALMGISRLQEKRSRIVELTEQESQSAAERLRVQRALEAAYQSVVSLPGQDLFPAAANSLANLLDAPVVQISRVSGDGLETLAGVVPSGWEHTMRLACTPSGEVVTRRELVAIPDGVDQRYPELVGSGGLPLRSYFGTPLVGSLGDVLGVVAVLDIRARELDDLERRVLEMHAVRLARELERERLELRERELEHRSVQSQKLEALGILAGGIAHEFNNVLAGIAGTAEALERRLGNGELRERARSVLELAHRGGDVVKKILAFARSELPNVRSVDLNVLVGETLALARHSLGPTITLAEELESTLPTVDGEPALLQQCLLNLLINARDAMPTGTIVVRTHRVAGEPSVAFEVQDAGSGIAPEHLPHIFEPFFTTKPAGQGTGLGLALVYRTVTAHQGRISIDSELGRGTKVTITLPVGALLPDNAQPEVPVPVGRRFDVLVVDDEPLIASSVAELLMMDGHRVIVAGHADEALAKLATVNATIDVAVLDIAMPGASGIELARMLLAIHPDLAIVFSSGHSEQGIGEELLQHPGVTFLQKPYAGSDLLRSIEEAVASVQPSQ
jgi:signal transduction histidine kinase/ActR/RegA family two-component response regulator